MNLCLDQSSELHAYGINFFLFEFWQTCFAVVGPRLEVLEGENFRLRKLSFLSLNWDRLFYFRKLALKN